MRKKKEISSAEMGFFDHLEELRWRIVKALVGIVIGAIVCWIFIDPIIEDILIRPAINSKLKLQNLRPFGQFFLYMQVAIAGGVILSFPNILYQLWKFIAPGLYANERKYIFGIVFFTSFCFMSGISFAYFLMIPFALGFFESFGTENIENIIAIGEYLSFVITVMLGAGLIFELPMVTLFLSRLGIVTPEFMKKYRRHAIVIIFIMAAILTPPEPITQTMLAVPLIALYEVSIFLSKIAWKKRKEKNE